MLCVDAGILCIFAILVLYLSAALTLKPGSQEMVQGSTALRSIYSRDHGNQIFPPVVVRGEKTRQECTRETREIQFRTVGDLSERIIHFKKKYPPHQLLVTMVLRLKV